MLPDPMIVERTGRASRDPVVEIALLTMSVFWALNVVALKWLLGVLPPPALSGSRFLIVSAVGVVILGAGGPPRTVARADLPRLLASGFLGVALYQVLFMEGLHRSSAFATNLLQGTEPLFALLLLSGGRFSRISARQWLGVGVALAGAAVFFLEPGVRLQLQFGPGDARNLLGAFVFALYGLVSAPLFARYPGRTAMAWSMIAGTLPLFLWSRSSILAVEWQSLGPGVLGALFLSALLPLYIGMWIWNWAVARKGLDHASLYIFVDILMSGLFAWVLLHERFGPLRFLGAIVILGGVALARSGERR
jgi:drug/metabolite transporter (DMT)-like permease